MAVEPDDVLTGPLPWQSGQWRNLHRAIDSGRLPHALLFCGRAGAGKRLFAEALAARLLCLQVTGDGLACGRCRGCRLREADNHPDIFRLQPPPDKQEIKIDQVRSLIDDLASTAQQGGYRIVIIDPAERLNVSAANSLLKILEEPGERLLFCLLSSRPMALPATVRSRCQRLSFVLPDSEQALAWLQTRLDDPGKAPALLAQAFGSPLVALQLATAGTAAEEPVSSQLLSLLRHEIGPVELAAGWLKSGAKDTLYRMYVCLAALLRLQLARGNVQADPALLELHALLQSRGRGADALYGLLDSVHELMRLEGSPLNQPLLFESLAIQWLTEDRGMVNG